jgi:predicted RNA binding protein YcfA (HicA-like mRNA interferase family)
MGKMTSLSNRDVVGLLKEWGFVEAGGKGGHAILEYNGRRVQVTAPGRSTQTPYKALRKAAQILGINLKTLLQGKPKMGKVQKVPVVKEDITVATATAVEIAAVDTPEDMTCPVCGKHDFKTTRGYKGHLRSHETVRCPQCGETFSRQGFPMHSSICTPAKRGRGRPRKPIAEAPERPKRTRDNGVEMPELLDTMEEDFPSPVAFTKFVEEAISPTLDEDLNDNRVFEPQIAVLIELFFPGQTLSDVQVDKLRSWVEATKALFSTF